jgi:addiction module HigA family antidote
VTVQRRKRTTYPVRLPTERPPSHPGELMREILEEHARIPTGAAAGRMRISRQSLHAVLTGRSAVTVDMALKFSALVGGEPRLWLAMQQVHDLWHAQRKLKEELARIRDAA